jgi:hypothetical protein
MIKRIKKIYQGWEYSNKHMIVMEVAHSQLTNINKHKIMEVLIKSKHRKQKLVWLYHHWKYN